MLKILTCRRTGKPFEITDKEIDLFARFDVPLPDLCFEERLRDLMAVRNERKLYRRKCDATGEMMISTYRPDVRFPVYKNEAWWADTWDATSYGRPYDFSRLFFEQFAELQMLVPREGTTVFNSENCDYNNHVRFSKNCYLNCLASHCEDTHYCYWGVNNRDVLDSAYTNKSTLCYECLDTESSYECVSLHESKDCHDCHFSYQLQNSRHCLFSWNLVNAEYRIFNKQVTKEEFEKAKAELFTGSYQTYLEARKKFFELRKNAPQRGTHRINTEESLGDHLLDCKNCTYVFEGQKAEDCYYSVSVADSKDVHTIYSAGWTGCESVYYSASSRGSKDLAFCSYTWFSSGLRYCENSYSSHDSFGSIGLRQKKYCILNKQYSEEEYKALMPKIIEHMKSTGEWGQFFPPSLSAFAYNETGAMDFYPLSKKDVLAMGFTWTDHEQPAPEVKKTIPAEKLPDDIASIPDDVLNWAILCQETGKPFRLIPGELKFYRKLKLPLPRLYPEVRHLQRFRLRNGYHLYERSCSNCHNPITTTYSPDRVEKVLCEQCYLSALY